MQPPSNLRSREQNEVSFEQLLPRSVRVSRVMGGGGSTCGLQLPQRHPKLPRELSLVEQQELRRKINSRERKRMQDLNLAMDALREVMVPYSSSSSSPSPSLSSAGAQHPYLPPNGAPPNGRRLSKISTLVLARNYILLLGSSLQEMRRLLGEVSVGVGVGGPIPRLVLTGGWPLIAGPGQLLLTPQEQPLGPAKCSMMPLSAPPGLEQSSTWGTGGMVGVPLCSCGVCKAPRVVPASQTSRFHK